MDIQIQRMKDSILPSKAAILRNKYDDASLVQYIKIRSTYVLVLR